uniref:ABC2_membrane domain-containing protein n=1 Tax=Heterorhabditis bacteriophora TaxID=37862 RepID=A0A1I7X6T8_HETBA
MAQGKTIYHGKVDQICNFFDKIFLLIKTIKGRCIFLSQVKIKILFIAKSFEDCIEGKELYNLTHIKEAVDSRNRQNMDQRYNVSFLVQLSVLFRRAFLATLRDPLLLKVKLTQIVVTAIAIGIINWRTPLLGPSIQNLEGVLYNCARDMTFLFFFPSINIMIEVITSELPIFMREYKARMYSVQSYYISKSLAELPQYTLLPLIYSTIIYWMTG